MTIDAQDIVTLIRQRAIVKFGGGEDDAIVSVALPSSISEGGKSEILGVINKMMGLLHQAMEGGVVLSSLDDDDEEEEPDEEREKLVQNIMEFFH